MLSFMPTYSLVPSAPLDRLLAHAWLLEGWYQIGEQARHQQFPQHLWQLTFCDAGAWEYADGRWVISPAARLTPLRLGSEWVQVRGYQSLLIAELYPWAARRLFGWAIKDPECLALSSQAAEIRALLTLGEGQAAWEALQAWLETLQGLADGEEGRGILAARQLYDTHGNRKIVDLAEEYALSPRQLERLFAAEVGVSPKALARLARFDAAFTRLQLQPEENLSSLAYDLGFTDQAHLNREFRQLAHLTPKALQQAAKRRFELRIS